MSFTISHAAAALPFYKSRLCFPALIVGCMVPDFEYFIFFDYIRRGAHSIGGLFYFCVPVGLVILFLYYKVWRYLIADLSPDFIRDRLLTLNKKPYAFFPVKRLGVIILSIIIGAILHDAWDLLSHGFGRGPQIFPWLLQKVPFLHIHWWALFYAVGTAGGLFAVMAALLVYLANTKPEKERSARILPNLPSIIIIGLTGMIFSIVFALKMPQYHDYQAARILAFFVLGVICYSIVTITVVGIWRQFKTGITRKQVFQDVFISDYDNTPQD